LILSDLLNHLERVLDHCSNIAGCVIEISKFDALYMHEYLHAVKNSNNTEYIEKYKDYGAKYAL
jgi:phosphate:Na+ symporter